MVEPVTVRGGACSRMWVRCASPVTAMRHASHHQRAPPCAYASPARFSVDLSVYLSVCLSLCLSIQGADLHEFVTKLRAYDFADFYKVSVHCPDPNPNQNQNP